VGLLNIPAIVIPASADVEPPPLRRGEILPDPDFSLLSPTTPFIAWVCMTAAMLVLEPIFEADLPPAQYAYRPGRNAGLTCYKRHPLAWKRMASFFGD